MPQCPRCIQLTQLHTHNYIRGGVGAGLIASNGVKVTVTWVKVTWVTVTWVMVTLGHSDLGHEGGKYYL